MKQHTVLCLKIPDPLRDINLASSPVVAVLRGTRKMASLPAVRKRVASLPDFAAPFSVDFPCPYETTHARKRKGHAHARMASHFIEIREIRGIERKAGAGREESCSVDFAPPRNS